MNRRGTTGPAMDNRNGAAHPPRKVKGKASPTAEARGRLAVDADMVIDPSQAPAIDGSLADPRYSGHLLDRQRWYPFVVRR
ncbi:MAG: hypothetical protein ACRDY2_10025 [Acidimicrobiales bacterium]